MCDETTERPFNPADKLIRVQGQKEYLPASARVSWMRSKHELWGIETEPIAIDIEREYAIFRAHVKDETGRIIGTGTKYEDKRGFPDFIEKAEKGAISRALAACGFGTDDIDDEDMEARKRPADAPRNQQQQRGQAPQGRPQKPPQSQQPARPDQTAFGAAVRDKANVHASGDDDATGLFDSVKAFEAAMPVQARNRAKSDWVKTKNAPPNLDTMDETDLRGYLAHLKQFTDGAGQ